MKPPAPNGPAPNNTAPNNTTPDDAVQHTPERPSGRMLAAWWSLAQVMKTIVAPMLEREYGVDFGEFVHMNAIENGAIFPSQLCTHVVTTPSNVSRMLETLEKRDLVRRSLDSEDSRRVRLELTPKGREVVYLVRESMENLLEQGLSDIPETQIHALTKALEHLRDHLTVAVQTTDPRTTTTSMGR